MHQALRRGAHKMRVSYRHIITRKDIFKMQSNDVQDFLKRINPSKIESRNFA